MALSPAEKFFRYLVANCTADQVATVAAKMQEGWKPFKVCGTRSAPVVLCSRLNGVRSNIAPEKDHLRIYHDAKCVRYDPRAK